MLDSSFLISLSNDQRPEHPVAKRYFIEFIDRHVPMQLSTIAICEYEVKQRIADLGLENFLICPFNIDDAITGATVFSRMFASREDGEDRVAIKDDAKLVAQCVLSGASHFITSDAKCVNRLDRIRREGLLPGLPFGISVREPFNAQWFNDGNQYDFIDAEG
ncbi:hypothetical protein [Bordetella bronchialis]|nr:hypothetical protein [Bordetella bronchialis]